MKVILTGATGFVGGEVLAQLLADPAIGGVICLSRRDVGVSDSKLTTIVQDDFARYDEALINRLGACDACIWTLGGKASDLGKPDALTRVTYDFTLALARDLALVQRRRFVFCYLSGMGADQTETAWFPWEKSTRHLKGRTERDLIALNSRHPAFHVHCARPGGILPRDAGRFVRTLLAPIVVGVDQLAHSLTRMAVEPRFDRVMPIVTNREIKKIASGSP